MVDDLNFPFDAAYVVDWDSNCGLQSLEKTGYKPAALLCSTCRPRWICSEPDETHL